MRVITSLAFCLTLLAPLANAQIAPQTATVETMADPSENWFIAKSWGRGAYIYDGVSGEMQGLLSLSRQTPAVQPNPARKEFYAAELYFSRGVHGVRTDLLTIYDFENLSPIAEVEIPHKISTLSMLTMIQLMGSGRHVGVFNITPGASVTIVDIENRTLIGEISTPGCALIMAVGKNDFLMICGDGTMQLVQLDDDGNESNRARSSQFFSVEDDPVFDRPVPFDDGWILVSHHGQVFHVTVDGDDINISDAWSMINEEDAADNWRPGGGQLKSVHEGTGLLYVLVHQGGEYTHFNPGTEVWVFNLAEQRRIARIKLKAATSNIMVTQESEPKLIVSDIEGGLHIYDGLKLSLDRTIADPGPGPFLLQDL